VGVGDHPRFLIANTGLTVEFSLTAENLDIRPHHHPWVPGAAWRIIPEIDKKPRMIEFAQSLFGRILLFALFGILLELVHAHPSYECLLKDRRLECLDFDPIWIVVTVSAAACAFAGKYRWWIVPFATGIILYRNNFFFNGHLAAIIATKEGVESEINFTALGLCTTAAVFVLSSSAIYSARRFRDVSIFRHHIICMIAFFVTTVLLAASPALHGVQRVLLWSFIGTFVAYFWFLGYAVLEVRSGAPSILAQLGTFRPFWGPTITPFGKGVTYLRKFESQESHELSVTQLKGLKLLLWVHVLRVTKLCFAITTHKYFNIPTFDEAFVAQIAGAAFPWYVCWGSLVAYFFEDLLGMVLFGGVFIACARMSGFRLLRNTYRPLESRTIAEFWNRYYFYYKELLVDFFFYPTFLRCFRKHKWLRLFLATFMAACVGNMTFHFMRDIEFVADHGLLKGVVAFESFAVYAFILSLGIAASQMKLNGLASLQGWSRRLTDLLRVGGFFCILHIFDAPFDGEHSLWDRFEFLFHLFGVGTWI
jgi:hypothetical protein